MAKVSRRLTQALLLIPLLICCFPTSANARVWTLSELDTLSDRTWLWIDKNYKDPISEYFTETDRPDKMPVCYGYSTPRYPATAERQAIEGSVWVKVLIDEKGRVRAARVLRDSGLNVGFEDAALSSAKKSGWKPATKNGKRVPVWVTYEAGFYFSVTRDGKPIKKISRWNWAVRVVTPTVGDSADWQEPAEDDGQFLDTLFAPGDLPVRLSDGDVEYPSGALERGLEGSVMVKVLVGEDGLVRQAKVVQESGYNYGFEESALWAAIHSKWKPAIQDEKPVSLWIIYEILFRIKKG
jgi:TonB family protein